MKTQIATVLLTIITLFTLAGCEVTSAISTPIPTVSPPTPARPPTRVPTWPGQDWETLSPAAVELDAKMLAAMIDQVREQKIGLHSALITQRGYLVSETYFEGFQADTRHEVYSCTKSVISALVGIAIEQGYIDSVQHKVLDYFPDRQIANNDTRKQAITLEHLLTMTSGLDSDERMPDSQDWVQFMLDRPMVAAPGTEFSYNSGNTHLLAAILRQATGMQPPEFARANLFEPLGISNLTWDTDPDGLSIGGWGIRMTPRDMARLGYLYLRHGVWQGRQVVPAAWVRKSTQPYINTDDGRGYGYGWWNLSFGGYAALGLWGQQIIVLPERDMVVVFTSHTDEKQLWQLVDEFIIPAQIRTE